MPVVVVDAKNPRTCTAPAISPLTMASLIAILDLKGKPLIQRSYRDDVPLSYVERFLPLVLDIEEEGQQVTPCLSSQGINFMHIRHSNLYCACVLWDILAEETPTHLQYSRYPSATRTRRRSSCFCIGSRRCSSSTSRSSRRSPSGTTSSSSMS